MATTPHGDRFRQAQADYRTRIGHEPHRVWQSVLFVLTATEGLWRAYATHITYTAHVATVADVAGLSQDEQLLATVARNLATGDAANADVPNAGVDLATCCVHMDEQYFDVLVAACRLLRGENADAARLLTTGADPRLPLHA